MNFYFYNKHMISRIEIAFSDLPWNVEKDDPYPTYVKELKEYEMLSEEELLDLKEGLEDIVIRSIDCLLLGDNIMEDHLDDAECAIECLRYVKKVYDMPHLEMT